MQLALAFEAMGNLQAAVVAASDAIKIAPDQFGGWYRRASVLQRLGRTAEAKADREHAMSLVAL